MESYQNSATPSSEFALLKAMVSDPKFEVSIGAYGAVGQIAREPRLFVDAGSNQVVAATETSSVSLRWHAGLRTIAFEMLSSDPEGWNTAVAMCLPERDARMSARTQLTMVNQDTDSIFEANREKYTYDIGVGKPYADICVRAASGNLHELMGCESTGDFLGYLLERDDCVWIFDTALGRIETRDRRRRHLVPQLLATNDTHSRTAPIPAGFVPVGYAFPPNPRHPETEDAAGSHFLFQDLLDQFGVSEIVKLKRRVERALDVGEPVANLKTLLDHPGPPTRMEIDCIRVALRQRRWLRGGERSREWEEAFDRPLAKFSGSH